MKKTRKPLTTHPSNPPKPPGGWITEKAGIKGKNLKSPRYRPLKTLKSSFGGFEGCLPSAFEEKNGVCHG